MKKHHFFKFFFPYFQVVENWETLVSYSINFKGEVNPKYKNLVKISMIFFKTGYARVPKVLDITGPYKDWDKQGFKTTNKDLIQKNKILADLKLQYLSVVEEWEKQDVNWTPVQLAHHFDKPKEEPKKVVIRTVSECFDVIIKAMQNRKRIKNGVERTSASTAEIYHYLRNSLRIFTETVYQKDFSKYYFRDIDEKFLNDYVVHLKKRGVDGGMNTYIKTFYGVFCYSKQMEELQQPDTDTKIFKSINMHRRQSKKKGPKTVNYDCIVKIENMDRIGFTKREQLHIDIYLLSFYCGGLANVDTCYLTYDCIVNDTIIWERHKFPKKAVMPFTEKAKAIAEKYKHKCFANYVLPIFNRKQITEKQKIKKMKNLRWNLNNTLKKVSEKLGIEHITWYSSRGTFITKMIDEGFHPVDVSIFSGNSPKTIYRNYFKQTDPEKIKTTMNTIFEGQTK